MIGSDWEVTPDNLYTKQPTIHEKCLFLSGCKINQNMEFGDIIYFILLLFFVILGFFNDSRKKRNLQQKQHDRSAEVFPGEGDDEPFSPYLPRPYVVEIPPAVPPRVPKDVRPGFRSSLDLVTDFEGQSSLKSSIFVYDADASFDQETAPGELNSEQLSSVGWNLSTHPLLAELNSDAGPDALRKGLIYGEIMQRKY
jgi:hypothetical protein